MTRKGLENVAQQFDNMEKQIKNLTLDEANKALKLETEPQTKLSNKELERSNETYLKPERWIADRQKFNPKFQEEYEYQKEYVKFIAENKEVRGEMIEMWTHPFGGKGAEFWKVPVGKPVWAPRYVAENIRKCSYHILKMEQNTITADHGHVQEYGKMVVENTVNRLTAEPVASGKSVFMGTAA